MKPFTLVLMVALLSSASHVHASKLGLKNFRELPAAYSTVMQIPSTNGVIQTVLKKVQSRLPQKGDIEEMSSPMVLAAFELAGSYCSAFLDAEAAMPAAERLIFKDVDFTTTPKQFTPSVQKALLSELAGNFWFRPPSETEAQELDTFFSDIKALAGASTAGTRQMSFLLCTYFGTSLQFLVD